MPSAQAQTHDPEGGRTEVDSAPLVVADVDRLLLESARVAHAGPAAPVRAWRQDLTEVLAVLSYAEAVLAGDAALLRHCLSGAPADHKAVLDDLARTLSGGDQPCDAAAAVPLDETLFARADRLVAPHDRLARADLTEPVAVRRLLHDVEAQLDEVGARRRAVENRLADIRAAVIRQYREGTVPPAESWLR
jgi:hypothetical protein